MIKYAMKKIFNYFLYGDAHDKALAGSDSTSLGN